ncbi:uncharacterized protein LOC109841757 [Asparagus officinalis]|uniref:uncharacterized protein LOC109841757 n=1 Tax=Asparagus officinalis TaxID=4686 RepID=UPI00098E249B|nr:uncharacterized protein LOC109841757 [Asparagus officinalis]
MLRKYGYYDLSELSVLYDYNKKLRPNTGRPVEQLRYSKIIGSLMYAMSCTRPDITLDVGMLSKFTGNLRKLHWDVVQRLMRYLKGPTGLGLFYSGYSAVIEDYSDARWCLEPDECRYTGGFVFIMGGAAV